MIPVFDGHNDILLRLLRAPERRAEIWLTGSGEGHLDLPRMKAGGFAGGFFAVYIPSPPVPGFDFERAMEVTPFALPLPDPVPFETAVPIAVKMAGHLRWMERQGGLKIVTSVADIRACMDAGIIAAILHMEGAEAIGPDLDALHLWHAAGLRSLGPVWSRPTVFGHGVPFAYPSPPDTGEGLTGAGRALVAECNALKVLIDLSHLNEKGFWDVADLSDAPLVATHSNAHAVTRSSRNLTDRQLRAVAETGGVVGLNYATGFLDPEGRQSVFEGWGHYLAHLDHMLEVMGEDHVALGSDFDGATLSKDLGDVTGLPRLLQAMADHGYAEPLVRKIAHENWLRVLGATWGG